MSDYLKSALGYLNGAANTNEYVGQILEINNVKLRVTRLLAEGGWALVFAVEDVNTGKEYALKRLIAVDEDANRSIVQEIETLKRLSGHPNVIQYLYAQRVEREDRKGYEYLLVTELCPGGTVADILRCLSPNALTLPQICKIAYQATRAVHHMHNQQPEPLVHRDIKLENFLIGADGLIKLCDFGSASNQQILPNPSWNAQKRANLEDQMAKYTTPMYRAPEMMDTWNNEPIGPPVDCWALGCVIYTLVTLRHPFPEGNKLAIVNGKYPPLPANPRLSCLHDIVKGCLEISPVRRLTTSAILERLAAIAESNDFDLREPPKVELPAKAPPPPRPAPPPPTNAPAPPPRPTPPVNAPPPRPVTAQTAVAKVPVAQTTGLFSSLKGGAGSFLRNIKDTSSKMMHSMQQSMARTELDISYLTSRIMVMPYPADGIESAYRANHVEDVRAFLQARHPPPARIQLYNLSRGRPNVTRLPGRHIDCSFAYACSDSNAPLLSALYQICQDIYRYLNADFNHIVVLYCTDGFRASATVACTLLIYARAFTTPEDAMAMFTTRRQPPKLQPSEFRSINYMSLISTGVQPHTKPLALRSLVIEPVPLFTRAKDGCRPYVDIYSNGALVFSTKLPEYEDMRLFGMMVGKIAIVLGNATVRGDVTLVIYHARQQLGRVIGIKIASVHFHTGYIPLTDSALTFKKKDLDDAPEVASNCTVTLNIMVAKEIPKMARVPAPWEAEVGTNLEPDPLFGSTLEMEETLDSFRTAKPQEALKEVTAPVEEPPENVDAQQPETPEQSQDEEEQEQTTEEMTFQEADLLNLGMPEASTVDDTPQAANTGLNIFSSSSQKESDLLGGFGVFGQQEKNTVPTINDPAQNDLLFGHGQPTKNENPNSNLNDFLFTQGQAANKQNLDDLFDPFGGTGNNLLGGMQGSKSNNVKPPEESFPRNSSVPNFAASTQNKDPFANLTSSLGAGLNTSWNGTPKNSNTPQSSSPAPASTPIHSSPHTHRNTTAAANEANTAEPGTKNKGDAFEDLLGSQGYNFFSSRKAEKDSPKTINQMRKVEAAKTMDPDRMKIAEWTEGKKGNLRALLCSMHTVLWPEADRWQRVEMHQLVTAADVKKAYRKACLAVHPDKQAGTANENIARLIFMELNNAWSTFENDASQQNLFS